MTRKATVNDTRVVESKRPYKTFKEWYKLTPGDNNGTPSEGQIEHPVLLEDFLDNKKNRDNIKNHHLLYVIKTKAEPKVFKVGKSEANTRRLETYLNVLGRAKNKDGFMNRCTGVYLYYLIGTKASKAENVKKAHNIKKYEDQIKASLSAKFEPVRGTERFAVSELDMLEAVISTTLTIDQRGNRRLLRPGDKIKEIVESKIETKIIHKGKRGKLLATPRKIKIPMLKVKWVPRTKSKYEYTWESEEWVRSLKIAKKALQKYDAH